MLIGLQLHHASGNDNDWVLRMNNYALYEVVKDKSDVVGVVPHAKSVLEEICRQNAIEFDHIEPNVVDLCYDG